MPLDRDILQYGTFHDRVLEALLFAELVMVILVFIARKRFWPGIPLVLVVAMLWTAISWLSAALSVGADSI